MSKNSKYRSFSYLLVPIICFFLSLEIIGDEQWDQYLEEPAVKTKDLDALNQELAEKEASDYEISPRAISLPTNPPQVEVNVDLDNTHKSFQPQTVLVEDTPLTQEQKRRNKINSLLQRAQQDTNEEATKQLNLQRLKTEEKLRETLDEAFKEKKEVKQTPQPQTLQNQASDYEKEISEAQKDAVINSIQEEISNLSNQLKDKPEERERSYAQYLKSKHYVGGLFNFYTSYPQVLNVDFRWSGGVSVGLKLDDPGFILEGSFIYSNYFVAVYFGWLVVLGLSVL